jgi:hypothetical protein
MCVSVVVITLMVVRHIGEENVLLVPGKVEGQSKYLL